MERHSQSLGYSSGERQTKKKSDERNPGHRRSFNYGKRFRGQCAGCERHRSVELPSDRDSNMRHETRGSTAAGNRAGTEERHRYVERRGARKACSNLAIYTTVRCRDYFRFDADRALGCTTHPSRSTFSSTCTLVRLARIQSSTCVRSVFPWNFILFPFAIERTLRECI